MTDNINQSPPIIVGVSGASGAIYAERVLAQLSALNIDSHLVISRSAEITLKFERDLPAEELRARATKSYAIGDIGAPIASGSFPTRGMIIAPCSVKTMAEIASGVTTSLLTRAADVVLKERRPLVLMVRETPLHLGHLRNMTQLAEMGAIIAPPVPAFYAEPQTIDELVDQTVGRALDVFGLNSGVTKRWGIDLEKGQR